jgi:hypothetical protein
MQTSFEGMSTNLKDLWAKSQAQMKKLEDEKEERLRRLVEGAIASVQEIGHPMVLVAAGAFRKMTQVNICDEMHEVARNKGSLLVLDTLPMIKEFKKKGNVILFITYEWLSWTRSGPSEKQFESMMKGIELLMKQLNLQEDKLWLWFDTLSIPQAHPAMRSLAVYSLYVYAGQSDLLMVNAPNDTHTSTNSQSNLSSVRDRAWTRTEQCAHCVTLGLGHLYTFDSTNLTAADMDWFVNICQIFEGGMTCCRKKHKDGRPCDKESLVQPLLGMYFDLYAKKKNEKVPTHLTQIWNYVFDNKVKLFPPTFNYETDSGSTTKDLFGNLLGRMEAYVDQNPQAALARSSYDSAGAQQTNI